MKKIWTENLFELLVISWTCITIRCCLYFRREEGEQGIAEMRRRYSPDVLKNQKELTDGNMPETLADFALHGVDNYRELNVAIRELVSSLHSPAPRLDHSPRQRNDDSISTSSMSPPQVSVKKARVVEMVTSSTEVTAASSASRPTVLREVTSYPVSSSTHHGVVVRVQNGGKRTTSSYVKRTYSEDADQCSNKRSRCAKSTKFRRRENGSLDGTEADRLPATSQLEVEVPPIMSADDMIHQAILIRDQNHYIDRTNSVLRSPQYRVSPPEVYSKNVITMSYTEGFMDISPGPSEGDYVPLSFPNPSESLNLDFNMQLESCISPGQLASVNSSFQPHIGLQESSPSGEVNYFGFPLVELRVFSEISFAILARFRCIEARQFAKFVAVHATGIRIVVVKKMKLANLLTIYKKILTTKDVFLGLCVK